MDMVRWQRSLKRAAHQAVDNPKFGVDNLGGLAREMTMSPDAFDNRIYGRVDFSDGFAMELYELIRSRAPEVAEGMLRDMFADPTISIIGEAVATARRPISMDELAGLLLKAGGGMGEVQRAAGEALVDGVLTERETEQQLNLIDAAIIKLNEYRVSLLTRRDQLRGLKSVANGNGKANGQ